MSKRWLDENPPEGIRRLLVVARPPRKMGDAERVRSRQSLQRAAMAPVALGLTLWAKGGLLAAGLVLASTATVLAVASGRGDTRVEGPSTPKVPSRSFTPGSEASAVRPAESGSPVTTASIESPPRTPVAPPKASAPRPPTSSPNLEQPDSPAQGLAAEVALLGRARSVLALDPSSALALADLHRKDFATGQLGTERELIAIDALVRLGRRDAAERRANPLLERPGPYHDRAVHILGPSSP
jgi:hypothetical protein